MFENEDDNVVTVVLGSSIDDIHHIKEVCLDEA